MSIKVTKFGGSSVADVIQIKKIKSILDMDDERRYVIVSAPGKRFDQDSKITDLLYSCMMHRDHNLPFDQLFQVICDRFTAVAVSLRLSVVDTIGKDLEEIREALKQKGNDDYIVSRGEYLNAKLIGAFIGYEFIDAAKVVKFDRSGRFLAEETNIAMKEALKDVPRAIIPGFYGAKPDGEIKTFSRGGSDITGSIVARAVEADVYENWTDVSGFLMADPRIVDNPRPIETISYKELRELSYMGASVLHEDAIYPARISNIPINIRNTNMPEDKGTFITDEASNKENVVTGIAGSRDFTVIAIYKDQLKSEKGFIRRLAGVLEDFDIPLEHMPSGIDSLSLVISSEKIKDKADELMEELQRQLQPDSLDIIEDLSLIATVGIGMSFKPGVSAKLFNALAEEGINIRMIDQGSSEINIIVGVNKKDFEKAIKTIYKAFVE